MDRSAARRVLAAGLLLGVGAEILLHGPAFGVNVPLAVAALLATGWLVRRGGTAPDPLDAWLPVAAMACAVFVALSGDRFLALMDTVAALAFTGAAIAAMSGVPVTRRSAEVIAVMAAAAFAQVVGGAARVVRRARPAEGLPRRLPAPAAPIARGLVLGLPIAAIFAVLFASADPIFRSALEDVFGFSIDIGDLPGRALFVLASAWLAVGLLSIAADGIPAVAAASLGAAFSRSVPRAKPLGLPEAVIVLVLVDLVSGAFVALQLAYLFGGLDTLAAAGMTYSDYARRGFFELVAAACLAGGLVVVLEIATAGRSRAYVGAALALVSLTLVVLASAWLRLDLYQQAYGWTELRLYVAAAIVALGVGLAFGAVLLVRDRMRWLGHGLAVIGLVALLGLNAIAPAAFVAERNVARVLDPSLVPADGLAGLDTGYLGALGDDAIPVLVEALPQLPEPDRTETLYILLDRGEQLTTDPAWTAPAAWNLSRERAKAALATLP
jgi:Domain of unknown function (DUF4173)